MTNASRNLLCPLLLRCILHILYNEDVIDGCDDLINQGTELRHKICGGSADAPFSAKDIAVC